MYKFVLVFILIHLPFVSLGCAAYRPLKGVTPEGEKVYLGSRPIEKTEAYQTYQLSSKSETAKLYYLLDRVKAARDVTYKFEDGRYTYFEAYPAALWILVHHYKQGEEARSFIRKEIAAFGGLSNTTTVHFPDGSYHIVYPIFFNELDLLEETDKQERGKTEKKSEHPLAKFFRKSFAPAKESEQETGSLPRGRTPAS